MKKFFLCLVVFFCFLGGIALAVPLDDGNPIVVLCPGPKPVFEFQSAVMPVHWSLTANGQEIPAFVCDGMLGKYYFSTTRPLETGAKVQIEIGSRPLEIHIEGRVSAGQAMDWYRLFEMGSSKIFPLNGQANVWLDCGVLAYCEKDEAVEFRLVELGTWRELRPRGIKYQIPLTGQWAAGISPLNDGRSFFRPGKTYRVECRKGSGDLFWYFSTAEPSAPATEKI